MLDIIEHEQTKKKMDEVVKELKNLKNEINYTKWQIIAFCVMLLISDVSILTFQHHMQREIVHMICDK